MLLNIINDSDSDVLKKPYNQHMIQIQTLGPPLLIQMWQSDSDIKPLKKHTKVSHCVKKQELDTEITSDLYPIQFEIADSRSAPE